MPKTFLLFFLLLSMASTLAVTIESDAIVLPSKSVSLSLPVEAILREVKVSEEIP